MSDSRYIDLIITYKLKGETMTAKQTLERKEFLDEYDGQAFKAVYSFLKNKHQLQARKLTLISVNMVFQYPPKVILETNEQVRSERFADAIKESLERRFGI